MLTCFLDTNMEHKDLVDDFDLLQCDEFEEEVTLEDLDPSLLINFVGFVDGEGNPLQKEDILRDIELYEEFLTNL